MTTFSASDIELVFASFSEELTSIPCKEVSTARDKKVHLQPFCGVPRFRQWLIHNGTEMCDKVRVDRICEAVGAVLAVQVVLLDVSPTSDLERFRLRKVSMETKNARVAEPETVPGSTCHWEKQEIHWMRLLFVASELGKDYSLRCLVGGPGSPR